jgi:hypothetical protein
MSPNNACLIEALLPGVRGGAGWSRLESVA